MKPISLKIKGLNSFVEDQTIDFNKLTDKGLFGIFGPTGSGKTTILDGITLALYGEVSRKSTNFINTNCDKANIHYVFQISGAENKIYAIDREFKRDKKSGNPVSGKCKIIDITDGKEEILADKVKEVTNLTKEILGLSLDDFTRTVVLPQGKFSEFLKLEGKNRREMLERLFNLQQYGDNLSYKLGRKISSNRRKYDVLLGEMKGYENINTLTLDEKTSELKEISESLNKKETEFKFIEDKFNKMKTIWNLKLELDDYVNKEKLLKEREEEIKEKDSKYAIGTSILKVYPYIEFYNSTIKLLEDTKKKEKELSALVSKLKEEKINKDLEYKEIKEKREKLLPKLQEEKIKAEDALDETNLLKQMKKELVSLKELKESLEENAKISEEKLKKITFDLDNILKELGEIDNRIDNIKIDSAIKEALHKGILYTDKKIDLNSQLKALILKEEVINKNIIDNEELKNRLNSELLSEREYIKNKEEEIKILEGKCPGDEKSLLDYQNKYTEIKDKWDKYNKLTSDINKNNSIVSENLKVLDELKVKENSINNELLKLKDLEKKHERSILANKLREELIEDNPCPVCGSIHHDLSNIEDINIDNMSTVNIDELESDLLSTRNEIIKLDTRTSNYKENNEKLLEEISSLGTEFKEYKVEALDKELKDLIEAVESYNKNKVILEKEFNGSRERLYKIEGTYNNISTIITENKGQLDTLIREKEILNEKIQDVSKIIEDISSSLNVTDFNKKNDEIISFEKEKEELINKSKELRKSESERNSEKEACINDINVLKGRIIKGVSIIEEKERLSNEKETLIRNKIGEVQDVEGLILDITTRLTELENSYLKIEKEKESIDNNYTVKNEELISIFSKVRELKDREIVEKERIDSSIKEENLVSIDYIKTNYISKEELANMRNEIDLYKSEELKVKGAIESLENKIKDSNITEEQWLGIQKEKEDKEIELTELRESRIKKEEEVKVIKTKVKELDELLTEKTKLDHTIALLNDLEKLFKGKKFVEFVAINRLKYVSREASKRLKEITNGNYGLEVDEDGKFKIRDYKNGGVERDASTLSGGETFLASLSLSLALSSEIQLKGTAPLELFFLDEGFGTLDDNLLEVVMSSLEKIHNDKLKIGLISHVDSIKNRVPVKLIVKPAEAGIGSKCDIELS